MLINNVEQFDLSFKHWQQIRFCKFDKVFYMQWSHLSLILLVDGYQISCIDSLWSQSASTFQFDLFHPFLNVHVSVQVTLLTLNFKIVSVFNYTACFFHLYRSISSKLWFSREYFLCFMPFVPRGLIIRIHSILGSTLIEVLKGLLWWQY